MEALPEIVVRVFVNSALRTGYMTAGGEAFGRASKFFSDIGHEYEFWIREGEDDDLLAVAMRSDMRFSAELRGMVLHAPPEAAQLPPGVEVRRVESLQCLQDFREIAAQGFRDEAPGCYDLVLSIFPHPATVLAHDTSAFRLATISAVRAGFMLGAKLASLEATGTGVPVYWRLGFREVLRYQNYWPRKV